MAFVRVGREHWAFFTRIQGCGEATIGFSRTEAMTTPASHSDIKLSYVYVIHHHSELPVSLQVVQIGFDVGGFEV